MSNAPSRTSPGTILVLPGSAYRRHAAHEGEPVAEWIRSLGWDARLVHYPVIETHPAPLREAPLAAVQAEIVSEREAGAERVGVLGFSAGGHLAGHAALAPDSTAQQRPDFAVLCYPVVSMVSPTHIVSQVNLLGESPSEEERVATSLQRLVTPSAPPMFVWHTLGDAGVPVGDHSYRLASALAAHGVPHELHVFTAGPHGIGLGGGYPARDWTRLAADWLGRVAAGQEHLATARSRKEA
ncbi:alpha/beta hydrolase [Jiangella anatolica]|uniref:Xylan esterase n=1 Tax=Jiangella anatolica TaxID=2670374 RepID=A0A2W2BIL2_9ACTN|nr:alpha/beta hydrolase [Jiangella anatolica]PZF80148.1 xylan esterase [Jiangella anatolica]